MISPAIAYVTIKYSATNLSNRGLPNRGLPSVGSVRGIMGAVNRMPLPLKLLIGGGGVIGAGAAARSVINSITPSVPLPDVNKVQDAVDEGSGPSGRFTTEMNAQGDPYRVPLPSR